MELMRRWMIVTNVLIDLSIAVAMYAYWSAVAWYWNRKAERL